MMHQLIAQPSVVAELTDVRAHLRQISLMQAGLGAVPVLNDDGAPILRAGDIVVYDAEELTRNGLRFGLWCLERQRPAHSMPREMFARMYAAGDDVRMRVEREIVLIVPDEKRADHWGVLPLSSIFQPGLLFPDGPYHWSDLGQKMLGPVVGLFRPSGAGSADL